MQTTFIPTETYDALTNGLAADLSALTPEVDGGIAHKVAEVLSRYGLFPADMAKQIVDDMCDSATRQLEAGIPAISRPA
ncbi:hypothetical protein [Ciceribacter thiooxidans]|uniref:Uncharacterized protein n=1 Tax=Ciceribacter thiooxidans TaxID=1969821 RepID=A0ABV7I3Y0_9HYPH|nr:hypothetical protein [Ciceribacter thiooxidans]